MGSSVDYQIHVDAAKQQVDTVNAEIKKEREWMTHLRECKSATTNPLRKKDLSSQIKASQNRVNELKKALANAKETLDHHKKELKRRKELNKKK